MKATLTTLVRAHLARLLLGPALVATLAIAAPAGLTAHAASAGSPYITVPDSDWGPINPHVLPVEGYNFTVNSPVLIEVVAGNGAVVAGATTINWGDGQTDAFRASLTFNVDPQERGLRVFAVDRATGRRGNVIPLHFIPHCKPYQCF